ncbi:MAG: 3-dehydroquinate synthase [Candidatus Omnitrophica bacterium]|nr:3-dehydroquinate synthase [Candidatus Omnitrophota bacterium]
MRIVKVPLGGRSYSILIGDHLMPRLGTECARLFPNTKCAIVSDSNVAPRYAGTAQKSLETAGFDPVLITVRAGEASKDLRVVQSCFNQLARHRLERRSFVVALGGGVVGDLAGFIAATYLRGIGFVQVPTTLLSQVDSSVGGKVGVNLKAGKNLVGAFYQPRLVLCDLSTLKTLTEREFRAGLAEVIKYGIIYDNRLFARLERQLEPLLHRDSEILATVVARCCAIKAAVVGQDETESGLRAILNFGHTIGHAIETVAGYGTYLHGEAIAIGQAAAARISHAQAGLSEASVERIVKWLESVGLPTSIKLSRARRKRLLAAMKLDKKVSAGQVRFVLAKRIGEAVPGQSAPADLIERSLEDMPIPSFQSRGGG